MAATDVSTQQICDFDQHAFTGEVFESRTGNWAVPGEMVCVMKACAKHAEALAAHPRRSWEQWLTGEGAEFGYDRLG